jgi:hypothetical protein
MELNVMMCDDFYGVTAAPGIWIRYGGYMKEDEMGRAVGTYREKNGYRVLMGRSEEKNLLGGPRCGWEGMDCIYLAWARYRWKVVADMVIKLWVP